MNKPVQQISTFISLPHPPAVSRNEHAQSHRVKIFSMSIETIYLHESGQYLVLHYYWFAVPNCSETRHLQLDYIIVNNTCTSVNMQQSQKRQVTNAALVQTYVQCVYQKIFEECLKKLNLQ